MKSPVIGRLLSATCLIAALAPAPGCSRRPEGDLPAPRPASQKEMEDTARLLEESRPKDEPAPRRPGGTR